MPFSAGQRTQLQPSATSGKDYSSFSGKTEAVILKGILTQLHLSATPGKLYGSFSGKVEAVIEEAIKINSMLAAKNVRRSMRRGR